MREDGSVASLLVNVNLNVDYMEVVRLENLVTSLYASDHFNMGFQEHAEGMAIGSLRDALTVVAIIVESLFDCLDDLCLLK